MLSFDMISRHFPTPPPSRPSQVIISAGFDAIAGDPLGECCVTPAAFGHLTRMMTSLGKPLALLLEGGYNLQQTAMATEQVENYMGSNWERG